MKSLTIWSMIVGIAWLMFYITFDYSSNWELLVIAFLMGTASNTSFWKYWRKTHLLLASIACGVLILGSPIFGSIAIGISLLSCICMPFIRKAIISWWKKADYYDCFINNVWEEEAFPGMPSLDE